MNTTPKYTLGDKVWTIVKCKIVGFEIGCLYREGDTIMYAPSRYASGVEETLCFTTKDELLIYLTADESEDTNA